MSESQTFKICRWIEDTLIKDGRFSLPGKKALLNPNSGYDCVLIDATEIAIERPKKTNTSASRVKISNMP